MARISETLDSRVGGTRGIDGVSGENRVFNVIAEQEDMIIRPDGFNGFLDPLLPDPRTLLVEKRPDLAIDSIHPWDESQRVKSYTTESNVTRGHWIVRVNYGSQVLFTLPGGIDTGWSVSARTVSVSKELVEEYPLNQSFVKGRHRKGVRYDKLDPTLPDVDAESSRLLGTVIFEEFEPETNETANFKAGDVFLRPTKDRHDRRINADVQALAVNYTRTTGNFSISTHGIFIASHMHTVNNVKFFGASAGFVLCTGITADPIAAEIPGQRKKGLAYRISVSFLWSSEIWTPEGRVATFVTKAGRTRFVKWNVSSLEHFARVGEKVVERFRVKRTRNFNGLINVLSQ